MSLESRLAQDVTARQITMFALFVGPGLFTTRVALWKASGIPESTLKSWAAGAAMPLHGALALTRFLPTEAMNMLTEPAGKRFAPVDTSESDWDEVAEGSAGLTFDILEAKRDGICHRDEARLLRKARELVADLSGLIEGTA